MHNAHFPTAAGIADASRRIDRLFLDSPLIEQATANAALGHRLFAKVETLNPIRSFKGRGTDWWMDHIPASDQPIVSASAGNFGQGLAYAAIRRRRAVVIFAAVTANPKKLDAMRRLGAQVILQGDDFDAAKLAARAYAAQHGYPFIEDGADKLIAEGAGTIAKEITEALAHRELAPDTLIVPLGNGALLNGVGTWLKASVPACRVIGVVATGAPAMKLSWEQNRHIATPSSRTIADGIAVREPIDYALENMKTTIDDVIEVNEDTLRAAVDFCRQHYGLIVEPAGAAGVAGLLAGLPAGPQCSEGQVVATVLCGGNVQ